MNIISDIQEVTANGVKELYNIDTISGDILINETRKEFDGNYTVVCFPFTKTARKSPDQIGQDLGEFIKSNSDLVTDFNVVKGFLNLSVDNSFWNEFVGKKELPKIDSTDESIMIEYSSPNTNKPLHLGHIRNNLLGYAVSQIIEAGGNKVIKANLINDRGIHICKSMLAWQKFGEGETPESTGMKGDHLVGKYYVKFDQEYRKEIAELEAQGQTTDEAKKNAPLILEAQEMLRKWEAKDEETYALWEKMNKWVYDGFDVTYKNLGVDFDQFYYESDTYLLGKDIVEEGLAKNVLFKKEDGSVWINLEDEGFVYLMKYVGGKNGDFFKVGISTKPERRRKNLEISFKARYGSHVHIEIIDEIKMDTMREAYELESKYHSLQNCRFHSEYDIDGYTELFSEDILDSWLTL